jgi:hypothetical protein
MLTKPRMLQVRSTGCDLQLILSALRTIYTVEQSIVSAIAFQERLVYVDDQFFAR